MVNAVAKLPRGQQVIDGLSKRTMGPPGGPGAAERARSRGHVVAVGRDGSEATVAEVHFEGPNVYGLTGELMAWAADKLAAGAGREPGVVGPVEAFGLGDLVSGCAAIGLLQV